MFEKILMKQNDRARASVRAMGRGGTMFEKILIANRGVLAAGQAKQNDRARASVRAMGRGGNDV